MRREWRFVVPLACMVLALGCSMFKSKPAVSEMPKASVQPGMPAGAVPVAVVPESVHKFGKEFSQEVAYTFVIRNTGDGPLEIKKVYPD